MPAILDGRRAEEGSLPTFAQHPRNLFTLLGDSYRLNVSEEATYLCPPRLCPDAAQASLADRMRSLSEDLGVVYAHMVLPSALEDELPSVSEGWGDFNGGDAAEAALEMLGDNGRPGRFEDWLRSIRPSSQPSLNFKHTLLPHVPWQYLPDGRAYSRGGGRPAGLQDEQAMEQPFLVRQLYQRHLLQLGYTDRLIGRLIARLKETGLWDRALVVVTADHGVSFRVGQGDRRAVTPENVEDIAPIPLFVKAPGQDRGRIATGPVQTIDILPTIADELGVRLPWRVDGRPAGQVPADRPAADMLTRDWEPLRVDAAALERRRRAALDRKLQLFGDGLYSTDALVGRPVSAFGAGRRRHGHDRRRVRARRRRPPRPAADDDHRHDRRRGPRAPRPRAGRQRAHRHHRAVVPVGGRGALLRVRPARRIARRPQRRRRAARAPFRPARPPRTIGLVARM